MTVRIETWSGFISSLYRDQDCSGKGRVTLEAGNGPLLPFQHYGLGMRRQLAAPLQPVQSFDVG